MTSNNHLALMHHKPAEGAVMNELLEQVRNDPELCHAIGDFLGGQVVEHKGDITIVIHVDGDRRNMKYHIIAKNGAEAWFRAKEAIPMHE